jgi:hypothetical protein
MWKSHEHNTFLFLLHYFIHLFSLVISLFLLYRLYVSFSDLWSSYITRKFRSSSFSSAFLFLLPVYSYVRVTSLEFRPQLLTPLFRFYHSLSSYFPCPFPFTLFSMSVSAQFCVQSLKDDGIGISKETHKPSVPTSHACSVLNYTNKCSRTV